MVNPLILDKMIKDTLRDIPSDEDVSSGEDDPNLMVMFIRITSVFSVVYITILLMFVTHTG